MISDGSTGAADWLWQRMAGHLDRPAIEAEHLMLGYRELLERADEVAAELRRELSPGQAVVVLAPRAVPDTVILLLAVWRAGVTAVMGDARITRERLDEMLTALPAAAVLRPSDSSDDEHAGRVETGSLTWQLASHDRPSAFPYGCPDPAYVITTSGSTGTPKLVLCRHSGLAHLADAWRSRCGYTGDSRVLQFAPASYDAMISELFVPLATGSTLVFETLGEPPSPERICHVLNSGRVTHATFPPTVLRHLSGLDAPSCTVTCAGEALDGALAAWLLPRCGRVLNAYGPCEATVAATAFDVTSPDPENAVPIGTPLDGVDVQLAAAADHCDGTTGETGLISIAGPTVAWGYVTNDALAAPATPGFTGDGRFVTGDLARVDADGQLLFTGRIDRQIKRWGHRVEPGAIERRLRGIPGVADCVLVPDGGRLHAFVVSDEPAEELAAAARELLPRHEQPSDWHVAERLPALTSDKLDVGALAAAATQTRDGSVLVDPRLIALWERFIGPAGDPDTDLFSAGGDSMGSMLLLSAVADEFGVSIDLVEFLNEPTLGGLGSLIAA